MVEKSGDYVRYKRDPSMTNDTRQGGNEKGVPQIEVTPEMIEAGCEVYADAHPDSYVRFVAERVVVNVFRAMASARS